MYCIYAAPLLQVVYFATLALYHWEYISIKVLDSTIRAKSDALQVMVHRLEQLHAQDAFCLLHHALSLPKMLYTLGTSPCFLATEGLQRSYIVGDHI